MAHYYHDDYVRMFFACLILQGLMINTFKGQVLPVSSYCFLFIELNKCKDCPSLVLVMEIVS